MTISAARVTFLLLSFVVCVNTCTADPWPVDFTSNVDQSPVTTHLAQVAVQIVLKPGGTAPAAPVRVRVWQTPVTRRQYITSTFGKPRQSSFSGQLYLHTGTDIRVKAPAAAFSPCRVFAMTAGTLQYNYAKFGTHPENSNEAVTVGEFTYRHITMDASLKEAFRVAQEQNYTLLVPRGTYLGENKNTQAKGVHPKFIPHLHLESLLTSIYFNALLNLTPWSDANAPSFLNRPSGSVNDPAVRVVEAFDSSKWTVGLPPQFGETGEADPPNGPSVLSIHGKVDILARVRDSVASTAQLTPDGGTTGGAADSCPLVMGYQVDRVEADGSISASVKPLATTIEFDNGLPRGSDLTAPGTSASFYRKIYFEEQTGLGTIRTTPEQFDYIVTNKSDGTDDSWDTDSETTRNGRYVVRVYAWDTIPTPSGATPNGRGNTSEKTRTVYICNPAQLLPPVSFFQDEQTGLFSQVISGNQVRLFGANFFTPLAPLQSELPFVEFYEELPSGGFRSLGPPQRAVAATGNNAQGQILARTPTVTLTPGVKGAAVAVHIRCDATVSPDVFDPALYHLGTPKPFKLVERQAETLRFNIAFVSDGTLSKMDQTGVLTPLVKLHDVDDGTFAGVAISGDGRVAAAALDNEIRAYALDDVLPVSLGKLDTPGGKSEPMLSRDGRKLVFLEQIDGGGGVSVGVADIPQSFSSSFPAVSIEAFSGGGLLTPAISPSGQYVAYQKAPNAGGGLPSVRQYVNGTSADITPADYRADARKLFVSDSGTVAAGLISTSNPGLGTLPALIGTGGLVRFGDVVPSERNYHIAGLSADGHIVLLSDSGNGFVVSVSGSSKTVLQRFSMAGDTRFALSYDGKLVLAVEFLDGNDGEPNRPTRLTVFDAHTGAVLTSNVTLVDDTNYPTSPGIGVVSPGLPAVIATVATNP